MNANTGNAIDRLRDLYERPEMDEAGVDALGIPDALAAVDALYQDMKRIELIASGQTIASRALVAEIGEVAAAAVRRVEGEDAPRATTEAEVRAAEASE